MINTHAILSLIKFYQNSDTYYRVHSPFLFDLLENTLEDDRHFYVFDKIESFRSELTSNNTVLTVEDLGAGSKTTKSNQRTIKQITNSAVSPAYQSRFLFKLAQYMRSRNIIELGTSMGISSLYLSNYSKKVNLISLEGSREILQQAKKNFKAFGAENISTLLGHFDDTFPEALDRFEKVDFVYIDGNHAKEPTLKYFEWCLAKVHDKTVLVFDDIYWSPEMTEAWEIIKKHPSVKLSLDMYYFGIVFFNIDILQKQEFKIVSSKFKPWQRYI